jgi:hypothetical protein
MVAVAHVAMVAVPVDVELDVASVRGSMPGELRINFASSGLLR